MYVTGNDRTAELQPFLEGSELRPDPVAQKDASQASGLPPQAFAPGTGARADLPAREAAAGARKPDGSQRRRWRSRLLLTVPIGMLSVASVVAGGYLYLDNTRHFETTDDAFVAARQFSIAPQVSGTITSVPVTDNQHVAAGSVIARIDDRQYRIALQQAQARLAAAQASIATSDAQIAVQEGQVTQNEWQVAQALAALSFAQQQKVRYDELAHTSAGTVQNAQQWTSQLQQQQAGLKVQQQALNVADRQLAVLKAQRSTAEANLQEAIAQRDQAELNLSYTAITAAQPGRVVQLSAAVGEYVQPGTDVSMFVPDDIWVTANFKENQLDTMRPGQPVTLRIDAYPDRNIRGHVASVQPGSGTAFSVLPAENATGNYVKIVQRVPVKIVMDDPPTDVALGPGMSVDPTVRINPEPSLYERLRSWL